MRSALSLSAQPGSDLSRTVKRHAALEAYADDIEAAYQALERGSAVGTQDGDLGTAIERLVKKVLQVETIDRDANLFALGCDRFASLIPQKSMSSRSPTLAQPASCLPSSQVRRVALPPRPR